MAKRNFPAGRKEQLKQEVPIHDREETVENSIIEEEPIVSDELVDIIVTNCKSVNIRQSPDRSGKVMFVSPKDKKFKTSKNLLASDPDWVPVYDFDRETKNYMLQGYIMRNFVKAA